jgi:hypothetical protein
MAESLSACSVYSVDITSKKIIARLQNQPIFSSLHVAKDVLYAVGPCVGFNADCVYQMPTSLSTPAVQAGKFPQGWAELGTHGAAITSGDNPVLYSLSVDATNLTVNHDTLFGFKILNKDASVISKPQRPYGGPIITFSLFGNAHAASPTKFLALEQKNNVSTPAYYLTALSPADFHETGAPTVLFPNDDPKFDGYPTVVGGTADSIVVAFYLSPKKPPASASLQNPSASVNITVLPGGHLLAPVSGAGELAIDLLVVVDGGTTVKTIKGWNQSAVANLVPCSSCT